MSHKYLEQIWKYRGARQLIREFAVAARRNRERALKQINDSGFPVFYLLLPELERLNLSDNLSDRSNEAARLCRFFERPGADREGESLNEPGGECLRWIFATGYSWDGPLGDTCYSAVLDYAAVRLITEEGRAELLSGAAAMMFRRNRKGQNIHDLAWMFCRVFNPSALTEIAGYLLSKDEKDAALACKLLHLGDCPASGGEKRRRYDEYLTWLKDNRPFLYLSGEHFGAASAPEAVKCDLEAKYLHREILPYGGILKEPLSDDERQSLEAFRSEGERERCLLAEHSYMLHREDIHAWNGWMSMGVYEQVAAIENETERV